MIVLCNIAYLQKTSTRVAPLSPSDLPPAHAFNCCPHLGRLGLPAHLQQAGRPLGGRHDEGTHVARFLEDDVALRVQAGERAGEGAAVGDGDLRERARKWRGLGSRVFFGQRSPHWPALSPPNPRPTCTRRPSRRATACRAGSSPTGCRGASSGPRCRARIWEAGGGRAAAVVAASSTVGAAAVDAGIGACRV